MPRTARPLRERGVARRLRALQLSPRPAALLLLLAAVALVPPRGVHAMYTKKDNVVELTAKNFDGLVNQPEGVALVEFYAPWCGHCKSLAPHFKTVATKLKGIVTVGAVDCDNAANQALCSKHGIQGFPTLKLFGPRRVSGRSSDKASTDFVGGRTAKALLEGASAKLSDEHVTRVDSLDSFEAFQLKRPEVPKVLLFTSKPDVPLMYKAISTRLHSSLSFGMVHESAADVVSMHEVDGLPAVVVSTPDGSTHAYAGELKAEPLAAFVAGFSADAADAAASAGAEAADEDAPPPPPPPRKLPRASLEEAEALDEGVDAALLALYVRPDGNGGSGDAEGDGEGVCDAAVSRFEELAAAMGTVVRTYVVEVPAGRVSWAGRYGVPPERLLSVAASASPCEPLLVRLPWGEDKAELEDYDIYAGDLDAKALQAWATAALPDDLVDDVTPATFSEFMFAGVDVAGGEADTDAPPPPPAGGAGARAHKLVLFSAKEDVPGAYRALAANFRATFTFGFVRMSEPGARELLAQVGVPKPPALLFMTVRPTEHAGQAGFEPVVVPYRGALRYDAMATWVAGIALNVDPRAGTKLSADSDEAVEKLVPQVTDDASFEEHCANAPGICVLTLLDAAAPSAPSTRRAIAELAIARDGQPFGFCWLDAKALPAVPRAFGLVQSDVPSAVALSAKRLRFAAVRGLGSAPADLASRLGGFIDGVLSGKVRTEPLDALPSVAASGDGDSDSGGGADAEAAETPVEEEFDLSEVMSEEVEEAQVAAAERLAQVEAELAAEAAKAAEAQAAGKASKKSSKKKKSKKGKSKEEL